MNSFLFQVFVEVSVSVEISLALLWPQICMPAETDDDFPLNDGQARNRNGVKSLICGFFLNERLKTGKAETVDISFFMGNRGVWVVVGARDAGDTFFPPPSSEWAGPQTKRRRRRRLERLLLGREGNFSPFNGESQTKGLLVFSFPLFLFFSIPN